VLRAGKLTPRDFLRRRVERVVPLYFVVIAIVTALALSWPTIFGAENWYSLRHILKSLAFISFTDGEMPVVYLGWSLEYEMFFYLAVAALMATSANVWRNTVVLFSALVVIGQGPGVSAALGHYTFFVHPLLLEFALGIVAAKLFADRRVEWPMLAAPAVALAVLLVSDPLNRAILFGVPSAALVYAAARFSRWRSAPSRSERVLERLGDASYSIYLAQVQTISFACMGIAAIAPDMPPMLLVLIVTAVVIAFGFVVNVLIERPLLRLCRARAQPLRLSWPGLSRPSPLGEHADKRAPLNEIAGTSPAMTN
jgi:exopolysaccharide production protein ExoZ